MPEPVEFYVYCFCPADAERASGRDSVGRILCRSCGRVIACDFEGDDHPATKFVGDYATCAAHVRDAENVSRL